MRRPVNISRSLEAALAIWVLLGVDMSTARSDAAAGSPNLKAMLPERVHGYEAQEPDGVYTADTLFDLIDGGAEVYRALNVRRVLSRRYAKAEQPDIIADIFDMGSSADAFGAYHHDIREEKSAGIGQESEWMGSNLFFWKDRYFVSVVALGDSSQVQRAVLALAKAIDGSIAGRGTGPKLRDLLPGAGLLRSHVAYFHGWEYLNTRYAIAEDNLLQLNRRTEGMLARYQTRRGVDTKGGMETAANEQTEARSLVLLLVRYPSTSAAKKAFHRFSDGHLPKADADGVARRDSGRWAGARLLKDVVVSVLDAPGKREIEEIFRQVSRLKASACKTAEQHKAAERRKKAGRRKKAERRSEPKRHRTKNGSETTK